LLNAHRKLDIWLAKAQEKYNLNVSDEQKFRFLDLRDEVERTMTEIFMTSFKALGIEKLPRCAVTSEERDFLSKERSLMQKISGKAGKLCVAMSLMTVLSLSTGLFSRTADAETAVQSEQIDKEKRQENKDMRIKKEYIEQGGEKFSAEDEKILCQYAEKNYQFIFHFKKKREREYRTHLSAADLLKIGKIKVSPPVEILLETSPDDSRKPLYDFYDDCFKIKDSQYEFSPQLTISFMGKSINLGEIKNPYIFHKDEKYQIWEELADNSEKLSESQIKRIADVVLN